MIRECQPTQCQAQINAASPVSAAPASRPAWPSKPSSTITTTSASPAATATTTPPSTAAAKPSTCPAASCSPGSLSATFPPSRRTPFPATPARPADQTFALTLAHTGARVSEDLAACPKDVDLEAVSIRIRTLKRRTERWSEVPVRSELLRALELVHALRSSPAKAAGRHLWP